MNDATSVMELRAQLLIEEKNVGPTSNKQGTSFKHRLSWKGNYCMRCNNENAKEKWK